MAAARSEQGFWEEFLGLYRSHPCLWDARSESYVDKHMKDRAYALLVRKCRQRHPDANREFVAKKIHNFRCGYRRELKKVRDSPRNGAGDPSYSPSLWYFDKLHFIEGSSESAAAALPDFEEEEEEANELVKSDPDIALSDLDSTNGGAATPFHNSTPELSLPLPFCELPSPEPSLSSAGGGGGKDPHRGGWKKSEERLLYLADSPPRPKRRASGPKKRSRPRKRSRHRSPVPAAATTVTNDDDDDCDVAGKKLAFDLRKMTEQQRCIAEKLVNEVVFYGKLGKLNENCAFSVTPENIMPLTLYYNMQHHYYQREPTVYDHKTLMQMANNS